MIDAPLRAVISAKLLSMQRDRLQELVGSNTGVATADSPETISEAVAGVWSPLHTNHPEVHPDALKVLLDLGVTAATLQLLVTHLGYTQRQDLGVSFS
jgi:hypothetical protein